MASHEVMKQQLFRRGRIKEILLKFPNKDLKELGLQIAGEFNCSLRKAHEEIKIMQMQIKMYESQDN